MEVLRTKQQERRRKRDMTIYSEYEEMMKAPVKSSTEVAKLSSLVLLLSNKRRRICVFRKYSLILQGNSSRNCSFFDGFVAILLLMILSFWLM